MVVKLQKDMGNRLARLGLLFQDSRTLLIVMQDHPDPDAIASAAGLRTLANGMASLQCSLAHGGVIGRAENRALAKYLSLNLHRLGDIDTGRYDLVALVDTQPRTGNNSLPEDLVPHIVIDHHPIKNNTRRSPFTDIRSRYGATATIIYEYLEASGLGIDVVLATALLYGIRSDTQDLGRECTKADIDALLTLYPKANKRMLSRIQRERVPNSYYQLLSKALNSAEIYGNTVVAGLGPTDNPDMMGEVADFLLRREHTNWVLCYGFHNRKALFSLRTTDDATDAGQIAKFIVNGHGTGGGHNAYAAGQINLADNGSPEMAKTGRNIAQRFKKAVKAPKSSQGKLLSKPRNK
jgi:nanoRNase/pAp phosphatase (c-di-AMP/oligoRNAs hydrolase)